MGRIASRAPRHTYRRATAPNAKMPMSSTTVARVTTITARSPESFDAAIREGIARSHATLRNVSGAWVKEQKVECDDGTITSYQVVLEVTFVLDD